MRINCLLCIKSYMWKLIYKGYTNSLNISGSQKLNLYRDKNLNNLPEVEYKRKRLILRLISIYLVIKYNS